MQTKIAAECPRRCGTRVTGEIDPATREFIHRFDFPVGAWPPGAKRTEVDRSHLATFAPDSKDWFVVCPVCDATIPIELPGTPA
jgi:hypothetical protein